MPSIKRSPFRLPLALTAAVVASAASGVALMPASAEAHQGAVQITCPTPTAAGTVTYAWTSFPASSSAYRQTKVDGAVKADGSIAVNRTGGQVDPFTIPADGQAHSISGYTDWTADGGGRSGLTKQCTLPQPITPTPTPPAPAPPQIIIREITHETRVEVQVPVEKVCVSRMLRDHTVRTNYPGLINGQGRRITRVIRAYTGQDHKGKTIPTTFRKIGNRWHVFIDARGRTFSGFDNDLRTTVVVELAGQGHKRFRLFYGLTVCRLRAGNQNDDRSRSPQIPVKN